MDTDSLFFELYRDLPRQGPGDNASTRKAFYLLKNLPENLKMLDVGCGSGIQTRQLAKLVNGHITAIDIHQQFLNQLVFTAYDEGISEKITVLNKSMFEMDFPDEYFDVIWSEGSMYIYGFNNSLNDWKRMLKPGGYIVCSHISWLQDKIPGELRTFWEKEYPEISTIKENLKVIGDNEYTPVDHFVLPSESWWTDYYNPLRKRIAIMRQKYRRNIVVNDLIAATKKEIELFKKYSDFYGYVFYIMRKQH